ncbi:MAG: hypothetical protein GY858_02160 [Candidatus Omnitrophica bacterium]|nr:hypothetical protein [Candidatus Omnitrophota bacterium]
MKKAQALIIAVFVMLILAVIGWTIVNFTAVDLEVSTRTLDSERALSIAEVGVNWAAKQIDLDGDWAPDVSDNLPHQIGKGEYDITVVRPGGGLVEVSVVGYIPSQSVCVAGINGCRAKRTIELTLTSATIGKVLQAKNYFDWSQITGLLSHLDGDITVINEDLGRTDDGYEGDGDATHNENGVDWQSASIPTGSGSRGFMGAEAYPTIDMDWFKNNATNTWPTPLTRSVTLNLDTVQLGDVAGVEYDYAQSFRMNGNANRRTITTIRTLHGNSSDPAPGDDITVRIETNAGGAPSGILADSNLTGTYTPVANSWNEIDVADTAVTAGTYWAVWDLPDQDNDTYCRVRTGFYNNQNRRARLDGGGWQAPVAQPDIFFEVTRAQGNPRGAARNRVYVSDGGFFTGMNGMVIKDYSLNDDWSDDEWARITGVGFGGRRARINNNEADLWHSNHDVGIAMRVSANNSANQNWYVGGGVLIDVSGGSLSLTNKSICAEKDIAIIGDDSLTLTASSASPRALLATKGGNIFSGPPSTSFFPLLTAQKRIFAGVVYSENGDVTFDYLFGENFGAGQRGVAIAGHNVYLQNGIFATYTDPYVSSDGFVLGATGLSWKEK